MCLYAKRPRSHDDCAPMVRGKVSPRGVVRTDGAKQRLLVQREGDHACARRDDGSTGLHGRCRRQHDFHIDDSAFHSVKRFPIAQRAVHSTEFFR